MRFLYIYRCSTCRLHGVFKVLSMPTQLIFKKCRRHCFLKRSWIILAYPIKYSYWTWLEEPLMLSYNEIHLYSSSYCVAYFHTGLWEASNERRFGRIEKRFHTEIKLCCCFVLFRVYLQVLVCAHNILRYST